jgi:hypothetical protein
MLFSERSEFGMIKLAGGRRDVTQAAIVPMLESITPTLLETRPTSDRRKHRLIDISRKWPCLSVVCGFSVEEGILRERRWWRSLSARRDPDSRYDAHQTAACYSGRRPANVAISFAVYTGVSFDPRRAAIPVFVFCSLILFAPCERPDEWEKI